MTSEFRRRRFVVLALVGGMILFALGLGAAGGVSGLAARIGVSADMLDYVVFFGLAIVVGVNVYYWRCPRCGTWLGHGFIRSLNFCPECGVALTK